MGLVNPYMVRNVSALGAGLTLELEADPGKSFLVKDILVGANINNYTDITIDKAMVGRFRTYGELGNHLSFPYGMTSTFDAAAKLQLKPRSTMLEYLGRLDIFKGFPIAEGQKMVVGPSDSGQYLGDVSIVYEEYDGGDIKAEDENGSDSSEYMIINYGDIGDTITTAGTFHVNSQNSPTEFPEFPFGKVVPAKTEIELVGILASEAYDWVDTTHISATSYLKLVRERTVLFDDERNGLKFRGRPASVLNDETYYGLGYSLLGNYSDVDIKKPFMLAKPIVFEAGEEFNMYITSVIHQNAGEIPQGGSEIGLIMKIRRVS